MHHPTYRIAPTTAFGTQVVEYWLEREIAQWVHIRDRSGDPSFPERMLYHEITSRSPAHYKVARGHTDMGYVVLKTIHTNKK